MDQEDLPQRRRTAAEMRAAHRGYSAASASRKVATGLVRVSLWVPGSQVARFKSLAAEACASVVEKESGAENGRHCSETCGSDVHKQPSSTGVLSKVRRDKRPCDPRQHHLDLGDV